MWRISRQVIGKLCVAYDVLSYSRLSVRSQMATQSQLADMLDFAFREAGLADGMYAMQNHGDGGLTVLTVDPGTDEPRLITSLVRALETGLKALNEDLAPGARVRLRIGMAEGTAHRGPFRTCG